MNIPIIQPKGCKNCKFVQINQMGGLECHWGPPTAVPVFGLDQQKRLGVQQLHSFFPPRLAGNPLFSSRTQDYDRDG